MKTENQAIKTAFTPLRVALMIFISTSIIAALVAFIFKDAAWSYLLGIFASVFILLMVFMQLMELVWLNSMRVNQKDEKVKKSYQKAMNIYFVLLPLGIFLTYIVLV